MTLWKIKVNLSQNGHFDCLPSFLQKSHEIITWDTPWFFPDKDKAMVLIIFGALHMCTSSDQVLLDGSLYASNGLGDSSRGRRSVDGPEGTASIGPNKSVAKDSIFGVLNTSMNQLYGFHMFPSFWEVTVITSI